MFFSIFNILSCPFFLLVTLRWSSLIKRVLTEQKAGPHLKNSFLEEAAPMVKNVTKTVAGTVASRSKRGTIKKIVASAGVPFGCV